MAMEEYEDNNVKTGRGNILCIKKNGETKFHILVPVESVGNPDSKPETVDYTVSSSRTTKKVQTNTTLQDVDYTCAKNRDNLYVLNQLDPDTYYDFAAMDLAVGTYRTFKGKVSYTSDAADNGTVNKYTISITPSQADTVDLEDMSDLYMPTVVVSTSTAEIYEIATAEEKTILFDEVSPAEVTYSVESSSSSVTAAFDGVETNKLVLTGVSTGSAVINVTFSATDYAPYTRQFLVRVA